MLSEWAFFPLWHFSGILQSCTHLPVVQRTVHLNKKSTECLPLLHHNREGQTLCVEGGPVRSSRVDHIILYSYLLALLIVSNRKAGVLYCSLSFTKHLTHCLVHTLFPRK